MRTTGTAGPRKVDKCQGRIALRQFLRLNELSLIGNEMRKKCMVNLIILYFVYHEILKFYMYIGKQIDLDCTDGILKHALNNY